MKVNYNKTITACFIGYIVQAIVNNFVPLLFLTFQSQYQIPLTKITMLVTFNFGLQLLVDLVSVSFIDKIGYRASMVIAHVSAALGLLLLPILPEVFESMGADPFFGILIAVLIYAIGGGLLEVLVSPIVEACPSDHKAKTMSLLHSFYCWGHVGVVVISTLFFTFFGIENWKYAAVFWALLPAANAVLFLKVPIRHLIEEGEQGLKLKELIGMKAFWIFVLMMVCAGASEQAVSQWASTFAEKGLGVDKTIGDLAGPMSFAVCMGAARAFYGKYGEKIRLRRFMLYSTCLCIGAYLLIVFVPNPVIGLLGCAISGMSVGIMWPGTFSMASATIKGGGTAMFAFLALAGDLGCSGGPSLVGFVSGCFEDDLRRGILAAIIFPILLIVGIILNRQNTRNR